MRTSLFLSLALVVFLAGCGHADHGHHDDEHHHDHLHMEEMDPTIMKEVEEMMQMRGEGMPPMNDERPESAMFEVDNMPAMRESLESMAQNENVEFGSEDFFMQAIEDGVLSEEQAAQIQERAGGGRPF